MKYVLISLSESSKIDFSGSEKLLKSDHLVFLYVKGKKTLPASVKKALEDIKAEIEYFEIASSSELIASISYLIGYHTASKHETIVITEDKSKLPGKVIKDVKVYSAFRSIAGASSKTPSESATPKKSTTAKKSTTVKKTTAAKKASSTSSAKKTTSKKTTTKKTASSKKKNDGLDVSDLLESLKKGDTKQLTKSFSDLTGSLFKK
ncbi:MAG: hypothetical protein K6A81_09460 [Clostridiales bacterium]|nr:hypothetical protein [Clostridiales bacterium]